MHNLPYILMMALIISHTAAIYFLNGKRKALPETPEGAAKAKQFKLIITMLYVEIPLITALIWFVIAPMVLPTVIATN